MRRNQHSCPYRWYLYDLGYYLKQEAKEAKRRCEEKHGTTEGDIAWGTLFAYYHIISLMQQMAEGFDIPLEDLRLEDINPDRDLIWVPPSVDNPSHE